MLGDKDNIGVDESHFYMWRTLFALVHADDRVDDSEIRFMAEALEDVDFSEAQRVILNNDMHEAKSVEEMFLRVTDASDQAQFFEHARSLVYLDGEYTTPEQEVLLKLKEMHMRDMNLDELIGHVEMQFEDENSYRKEENLNQKVTIRKAPKAQEEDCGNEGFKAFTFKDFFSNLGKRLVG